MGSAPPTPRNFPAPARRPHALGSAGSPGVGCSGRATQARPAASLDRHLRPYLGGRRRGGRGRLPPATLTGVRVLLASASSPGRALRSSPAKPPVASSAALLTFAGSAPRGRGLGAGTSPRAAAPPAFPPGLRPRPRAALGKPPRLLPPPRGSLQPPATLFLRRSRLALVSAGLERAKHGFSGSAGDKGR